MTAVKENKEECDGTQDKHREYYCTQILEPGRLVYSITVDGQ
jgi:hypothetical protein